VEGKSVQPKSNDEILSAVRAALAKTLRLPESEITPDSDLEAIGLDSMAMIHVNVAIEEHYGVAVAAYDAPEAGIRTVADLAAFAAQQIAAAQMQEVAA
jgi:acyl carrier protein